MKTDWSTYGSVPWVNENFIKLKTSLFIVLLTVVICFAGKATAGPLTMPLQQDTGQPQTYPN